MKCCLICGKVITNRGKYYDLSIGSTCYQKNSINMSMKSIRAKITKKYKHKSDEDKSIMDLPLFKYSEI